MFNAIPHFLISVISSLGYFGVGLLMAVESAAIPLPSEVIMPFAGYLVLSGKFSLFGISLAGAVGNVVGSIILYYIGYYGGRPLIEKYGKYVLLSGHDLNTADKFFAKYGSWSNFFARLLPIVRTYISFPAGIAKMKMSSFILWSFIGSFIWSMFLGYIGLKLGQNWQSIHSYFHNFDLIVGVLIIAGLAWFIYRHLSRIRRGQR